MLTDVTLRNWKKGDMKHIDKNNDILIMEEVKK